MAPYLASSLLHFRNNTLQKSKLSYPSLTHFALPAEESEAFPISNLQRSPRPLELPAVRATQSKVGRFHQLCEVSKGARQSL